MICGTKWKGCECPWFNYEAVEADRLAHMQPPPMEPDPPNPFRATAADGAPESPLYRGRHGAAAGGRHVVGARHRPPHAYDDEPPAWRAQERRDEELARRLQRYEDVDDEYSLGVDDFPGHYAAASDDSYRRRPHNIPVPAPPPPPPFTRAHAAASTRDGGSGGGVDYVAGVNRERGVRDSSLERGLTDRLADRFSEHRQSPGHHRPGVMAGPPPPPSMPRAMPPMQPMQPMPPPTGPSLHQHHHYSMPGSPMMRRHTFESELYGGGGSPTTARPPDRFASGRSRQHHFADEVVIEPFGRRHHTFHHPPPGPAHYPAAAPAAVPDNEELRSSTLAGLTGPGRGMSRVFEWRNHVEPGMPEDDSAVLPAAAAAAVEAKRKEERPRSRRVAV